MKWPRVVGLLNGIRIYESSWFGKGFYSGGLALPGIGIFVGEGTFSNQLNVPLVFHEYGHFLQFRQTGWLRFYFCIGLPSLISACTKGFGKGHQHFWTEQWCNFLINEEFDEINLPDSTYPARDLSTFSKRWLTGLF